ncbi:MAG: O-antigen ligase family protein [Ignavibacteriaceae bacterium]
MQIKSRFNRNLYFYLLIASACSFLLSLFLLQLFVGALSILWIFDKFPEKKKAFDIFGKIIFIFLLVRIISILFSSYPADSNQAYYKDALFYFGFFSFDFYLKALDKKRIKIIVYSFAAAAAVIALIGLFRFNLSLVERAQSFSSGYSTFSSYLLAGFGVLICLSTDIKKGFILKTIMLALIFAGVITSLGRTNMVTIIILFIAAYFFKKINIKEALVIILLTVVFSAVSFYNNSVEANARMEQPASLSDRDVLMKGSKDLFLEFKNPILGYGPRTFKDIFPYREMITDKGIGSWHNDFIQIYFESGILGLAALLTIIIATYYFLIKLLKNNIDNDYKTILLGALLGLSGLILSALTAGFIDSPVLSIVFAFLISLVSGINYLVKTN